MLVYNIHVDNVELNLKTEKAIRTIKSICEFRGQLCFSAAAVAGHLRQD